MIYNSYNDSVSAILSLSTSEMLVIVVSGTKHLTNTNFTWVQQTPVVYLWQKEKKIIILAITSEGW